MATPLLQLLRTERAPGTLDYFGGTRTDELQAASDLMDRSFEPLGASRSEFDEIIQSAGPYDLIINLESTPFSKTLAYLMSGEKTLVGGPCAGDGGRGEQP